jgi:hypothetical protein
MLNYLAISSTLRCMPIFSDLPSPKIDNLLKFAGINNNRTWCTVPSFGLYDKVVGGSSGFDSPCPNDFSVPWIFSFYFPEHLFWINFGHR